MHSANNIPESLFTMRLQDFARTEQRWPTCLNIVNLKLELANGES
jgi:hypothetical protein